MRRNLYLFIFTLFLATGGYSSSWEKAQQDKKATLEVSWFTSTPFIYEDSKGNLAGMEHDILIAFGDFLREKHQIDLNLHWKKSSSFHGILENLKSTQRLNTIGVSAFSITKERQEYLQFTNSYLPDITVLVSSQGTPIVRTHDEIHELMHDMVGVTIRGTNYETLMKDLKKRLNLDFEIQYISNHENVLDNIAKGSNRFGFIDLPIYLILIKKGGDLTRQNLFTFRGNGYGVIMPKHSDWIVPFNAFLADTLYQQKVSDIISKNLGNELYEFIDNLYAGDELGTSILTKEKELQLALIKNANLRLEENETFEKILIVSVIVTSLFLAVIAALFFKNQMKTKQLLFQKNQIEFQQEDIRQKNEQLVNRNIQLIGLNEEKTNLMKIFAHDLRSPLSQIIGLSDFLYHHVEQIDEEDRDLLKQINGSAIRIGDMIHKILDVESVDERKSIVLREQVKVCELTQEVANRYLPIAAQKEIAFELQQPPSHFLIETDYMLLFLVLENLVSNAVKFSQPHTKISLRVEPNLEEVLFVISDEGPGFTESDQLLLFNSFQPLSAKPTGGEPTIGLGLSIVKKYVTDLGGKVWLDPSTALGSSFVVSLPL